MAINDNRINVDITADDQLNGDLASRLVAAAFQQAGFEDVTNVTHHHIETDSEVIEAMRNINPSIFGAEVVIEASTFESLVVPAGTSDDDDLPGPGVPNDDDDEVGGSDEEIDTRYED